ncbi:fluoride efflux transporter CrcB [Ferviditalea candida]|uniref:Fluoride-specific ion channel FluC n=1 Tax=Ferviditalea candida TaxID=3108399 RepID=A0ABU5ZGM3_9BACL|nr:fluoride efflux transporter CrcB [Paenibacillaceae bacterium T2]
MDSATGRQVVRADKGRGAKGTRMLWNAILVGAGGFLGAMARYFVSEWYAKKVVSPIPLGTLTVNLLGCFLLGLLAGRRADTQLLMFMGVGFFGAFTTFSTFKLESHQMLAGKRWLLFIVYTLSSYLIGIFLGLAGYMIGLLL